MEIARVGFCICFFYSLNADYTNILINVSIIYNPSQEHLLLSGNTVLNTTFEDKAVLVETNPKVENLQSQQSDHARVKSTDALKGDNHRHKLEVVYAALSK